MGHSHCIYYTWLRCFSYILYSAYIWIYMEYNFWIVLVIPDSVCWLLLLVVVCCCCLQLLFCYSIVVCRCSCFHVEGGRWWSHRMHAIFWLPNWNFIISVNDSTICPKMFFTNQSAYTIRECSTDLHIGFRWIPHKSTPYIERYSHNQQWREAHNQPTGI